MEGGRLVDTECDTDNGGDGDEVGPRDDEVSDAPGTVDLAACSDRAVVEWFRWSKEGFADDGVSPFLPDSLTWNGCMAELAELAAIEEVVGVVIWMERGRLDERICEVMSASSPGVTSSKTRWDILEDSKAKQAFQLRCLAFTLR